MPVLAFMLGESFDSELSGTLGFAFLRSEDCSLKGRHFSKFSNFRKDVAELTIFFELL